ncbi:MAG: hypothetical protein JKY32_13730 [Rhizobiales bacterium]|nr:hypothetical protein [Hyphomicrobiales bacterium]
MVAYDGKIWFVNSNPFQDFNAADIYSFNPDTGHTRYERGLFSQDAGRPIVYRGALYWPFEDPRSSIALGEYAVTDGKNWQLNAFTTGISLHVHAMENCKALLVAGTGGWVGALQMSPTGRDDWREVYQFQSNEENLGRITDIRAVGERCFMAVTSWNEPGPKLVEWRYNEAVAIADWPNGDRIVTPVALDTELYAINQNGGVTEIWRYDGETSTRMAAPEGESLRALASNGTSLFLLTGSLVSGTLWQSTDGETWQKRHSFENERPIAVYVTGNDIYVGTYSSNGQGSLWGPEIPENGSPGPEAKPLENAAIADLTQDTMMASQGALFSATRPTENYMAYRHEMLSVMLPLALGRNPLYGHHLSDFMHENFSKDILPMFTEQDYSHSQIAQWLSLSMIALNGNGHIPLEWISREWPGQVEQKQKYFYPQLAAIRAVRWVNQNDGDTISALLYRLVRDGEPLWLKADIIASLSALTGERFGYDFEAWANWWVETGIEKFPAPE